MIQVSRTLLVAGSVLMLLGDAVELVGPQEIEWTLLTIALPATKQPVRPVSTFLLALDALLLPMGYALGVGPTLLLGDSVLLMTWWAIFHPTLQNLRRMTAPVEA